MKEFKINRYITLKLERNKTNIYVNERLFKQCYYLKLNIPVNKIISLENIESIDEAVDKLGSINDSRKQEVSIDPETEFMAHCSNLQVWIENNYNSRLIHSNLAFPLLKKLYEVNDPLAKKVFKEEIIERFKSGYPNVIRFLICEGYIDPLSKDERHQAFKNFNYEYLKNDISQDSLKLLEYIIDLGAPRYAEIILKEHVFTLLNGKNKDSEIFTFLINYDLMRLFTKEELESLQIKKIVLDYPFNNKIPSEIGFLKSLEELSIYTENIVIKLPDTIGNLNSLKKLHLLGCEKVEKIPQTITQLKSLRSLSLPYYISYIPEWIGILTNLEELELSVNNIKKLPRFIKNLKNLKILKIYSSQNLENKDLLKDLPNLEKLDFY
ncbi:MAG: leucine-rich repeat domain-containing protein [Promethearchaeota archaeon]